uniref:Uncharacterized protein n=1 Tax=Anguilla anguilla TaxID=7936 RepID=A0A0E9RD32_ANGAN
MNKRESNKPALSLTL